jgi:triacylglycerol esterase/lipase EstA (alpha/beta hydrolase family)
MIIQLDILLYLDTFRNIDVFLQGLYYLQFQISGNAIPYFCDSPSNFKKFHNLAPPQILDNAYTTKIFMLKYAEEVIKMMETVVFRLEIDGFAENPEPVSIQVELMFTDLQGDLSPGAIHSYLNEPPESSLFGKVAEVSFSVNSLLSGVNQLVFVTFLDTFSSSLSATVHVFPTNYKIPAEFIEALFPEAAEVVSEREVDKAYDQHLIPVALCYNKLCKLMTGNTALPIALPILYHADCEAELLYQTVNRKLFSNSVGRRNKAKVAEMIIREIQEATALMLNLKHTFMEALKTSPHTIVEKLLKDYITLMDDRWGENVIREVRIEKIPVFSNTKSYNEDMEIANKLRRTSNFSQLDYFSVVDDKMFVPAEENTILIESVYCNSPFVDNSISKYWSSPRWDRSRHLIILVHGYLGSYIDVKMLQDTISNVYPKGLFLLSRANEGTTDISITEMGVRLADEIKSFMRNSGGIQIEKISFIGHSLGGLIIRSCLPHLATFKSLFYSYISLACPHLGCLNNESRLVDAGMWLLCKVKQSVVLDQLTLADSPEKRQTVLFNLSKEQGLGWFKKVYFFSSCQDSYVPFHSARAEVGSSIVEGDIIEYDMASNILSQITGSFHRVNTIFSINFLEVGSLIGRSAHIMFLDNVQFLNILVFKYIL